MKNKIDFNNKTFVLIHNSENGQVNPETLFHYKQEDELVTADYTGGPIKYGKIIALLNKDKLNMRYQCVTQDNELLAGKALATILFDSTGKMKLSLKWVWLSDSKQSGVSEYIEV